MLIDAHIHCSGRENTGQVLRALDGAGVDFAVLLAPFLEKDYRLDDAASLRRANAHLAALVSGHRDRLCGLAVVDPSEPDAPRDLRQAIEDLGLSGAKMVPSGWYPDDPRVQPTFAVASALRLPLLFHSGVFIDGRSSRFCRPAFFEVLRDHPGARVTLAHLGWPWTDEAIGVGLIDLINGVAADAAQFRFDLSFGAPPVYRRETVGKALAVLGPGLLQFGSDCFLPCAAGDLLARRSALVEVLDALDVAAAAREQIFGATAAAWLGPAFSGRHAWR